ncbi:hypothetical protein GOP47_0023438 [Adiantum capillus-veneris]|uniref:Reduced growth phenotype protein 1 n=1 Tax=Adiantum capillus-veneris TaxID=13818 RepID=A0A9D4U4M9_ADICA|nr:hypothetical protein GOP47_0023438 [Adiantum capillus-veneris]
MLASIPEVFPFLKRERQQAGALLKGLEESSLQPPSVKLSTDKPAYRPGDTLLATIEVSCDKELPLLSPAEFLLLESLVVQVKGIEKLDPQWLLTPEVPRGSKERRGERIILESSPTSIVSDVLFEQGARRTYLVRTVLPKVLPPTYKGTVIRYLYYFVVSLQWSIAVIENGNIEHFTPKTTLSPKELKTFLNIWTLPTSSGLTAEEPQIKDYWGIVPQSAVQVEIYWKEKNDENDWARASDVLSEIEDEDASQSTESLFQSPDKGTLMMSFEKGIQLQSPAATPRAVFKDSSFRTAVPGSGFSRKPAMLRVSSFASADGAEGKGFSDELPRSNHRLAENDAHDHYVNRNHEHEFNGPLPRSPSGTYARGRSYNIRFDDQVLARFSPRNPDSTYYFGDVVGGVLSFFHDEGSRRCLEISAVLETREMLNPSFIHPSRKNSPVITKVQAEFHEAVADMLQTHFVFSIPFDGPPSFTTSQVSLQWVLRFEFVTTARDIDWSQYEHPLLIDDRDKGEWSIPILVHAPLPKTQKAKVRRERPSSPRRDSWGEAAGVAGKIPPLSLPPSNDKLLCREQLASSSFDSI